MEIIARGQGRLLMDPDPDRAREFFRTKSRAMVNKMTTVKEAVKEFIHPGDYLVVGAFGAVRIPTAILHEIIRQGIKGLKFGGFTATHDFEILAAGESFDFVDNAYIIGLEARGLSPHARRYMESGKVEVVEWSNASFSWRIRAAAMGVPFMPGRVLLGTDTFRHSAAVAVRDPFTGKPVALYPALYPDVAVIHVHEADIYGNARIRGILVSDDELAIASKRVIITAERIIPHEEIRREPERTTIPYYAVDAVVEVPYGSYPGNMPYEYYSDEEHLRLWLSKERDPEEFKAFLKEYIFDTGDFSGYLEKCGGIRRLQELRWQEYALPGREVK